MSGKFEGLTDEQWGFIKPLFPEEKRTRGYPKTPPLKAINSIVYILITGCRWCDLPKDKQWASKSSAHRWMKRWNQDGTLDEIKSKILMLAQKSGEIGWEHGAIDGSFSPWEGRR